MIPEQSLSCKLGTILGVQSGEELQGDDSLQSRCSYAKHEEYR
jgi:hypothetical protein